MTRRLVAALAVAGTLAASASYAQQPEAPPEGASAPAAAPITSVAPAAVTAPTLVSEPAGPPREPNPFAGLRPPPPSRMRPAAETEEAGLWGLSDRAEQEAQASGELERDPELNLYVRGVACRVSATYCGDVRLYVFNRPFFNAAMAPNGYMEVWSGLLLRVDNEAQLAFVLGHEIAHYSEQHSLASYNAMEDRANAAMVAGLGLTILGAAAAVNSPNAAQSISDVTRIAVDAVYLGTIASLFGYSRELEESADALGFQRAVAAGYDRNAGSALWRNLIAEAQASDNPDVRRRIARGSIFNTHPLSADRVAALDALAARPQAETGAAEHARYRAMIRPFLDQWLRADLRRRDYGQTLALLDRLGAQSEDAGVVEYYRAEVYRLRRQEGDRDRAAAGYAAAILHADAPASAWRELGDIYARDRRNAEAAEMLAIYLAKAPNAQDRQLVEVRLARLQSGGTQ